MNAWSRKGRQGYAEWLPEVELRRTRWEDVRGRVSAGVRRSPQA